MKHALLLPALALLLEGSPPDRLGVGVASVLVEPGVSLALLAAPGDAAPVATVELVWDEATHSVVLAPTTPDWLRPEMLALDYALLTFRVLAVADGAFEVVVDEGAGRTLWLHAQPAVEYKPWGRYLVENVTGFDRLDPAANPLRAAPDEGAAPTPYDGQQGWDCLAVAEVRGEWARVRLSELCASDDAEPVDGWVRWRDGEALLIGYGLTC